MENDENNKGVIRLEFYFEHHGEKQKHKLKCTVYRRARWTKALTSYQTEKLKKHLEDAERLKGQLESMHRPVTPLHSESPSKNEINRPAFVSHDAHHKKYKDWKIKVE